MYIIYETYTDETRNLKDFRFNTRIIGLCDDEKRAVKEYKKHLDEIVLDYKGNTNWYIKKYDKKLMKETNKNAIIIYEVFNDFVENYEEIFYVVLEKVEVM